MCWNISLYLFGGMRYIQANVKEESVFGNKMMEALWGNIGQGFCHPSGCSSVSSSLRGHRGVHLEAGWPMFELLMRN